LRRSHPSSKESFRLCEKDYETEEQARAQQGPVEPLMNEINEYKFLDYIYIYIYRRMAGSLMGLNRKELEESECVIFMERRGEPPVKTVDVCVYVDLCK
jgi:hypothetical protein